MHYAKSGATAMLLLTAGVPDHPFIFGIRERRGGLWLFLGRCADPS